MPALVWTNGRQMHARRMLKKFVQQGRRRVETGGVPSGVPSGARCAENGDVRLFQHPLLGFVRGGQGLVDFPDKTPFNFRDLFYAHAEDASTLGEFFEVSFDVEPGDVRRECMKGSTY